MLTQQILNLIQISDQFYNDVTLVRLMELLLIYPEVHPLNRNELTNRNMVRLKTRQRDLSSTFFSETLVLKFLTWCSILSPVSFVTLFLSGLCIDLRTLLLGTLIWLHFSPACFYSISFLWITSLTLQKRPHLVKFTAKSMNRCCNFQHLFFMSNFVMQVFSFQHNEWPSDNERMTKKTQQQLDRSIFWKLTWSWACYLQNYFKSSVWTWCRAY